MQAVADLSDVRHVRLRVGDFVRQKACEAEEAIGSSANFRSRFLCEAIERRRRKGNRFCDLRTRTALSREREPLRFAFDLTGIEVIETRSLPALARCYPCSFTFYVADPVSSIRFQVRRLPPFRPCVSMGAVERVNVSLFRSSWAWRC